MKNAAFVFGTLLSIINVALDVWLYLRGTTALAALLCIGTILVFATGIIWVIYQGDNKFHVRRWWLAVPLGVFGYGMALTATKTSVDFVASPENLAEVGRLMTSKYQIALWLVSLLLFFVFVMSATLLTRRRA